MIAFLLIGGVGVVVLLISLILGDLFGGHLDGLLDSDLFSTAALAGFVGAFGFVAALVLDQTGSTPAAVVAGLVGGVALGVGAGWLSHRLRQGEDSAVRTSSLVGRTATVLSPIPEDGYGQVSITVGGHITRLNARSAGPISAGQPVTITDVLSATSVLVAPNWR